MTYRDDANAMQARIRTLEAELEAERQRREAAEAGQRAAEAARDELRAQVGGAAAASGGRRSGIGMPLFAAVCLVGLAVASALYWTATRDDARARAEMQRQMAERERAFKEALTKIDRSRREHEARLASEARWRRDAQLRITARPQAEVYVDERRVGTTPLEARLDPGRHEVRLQCAGCQTIRRVVTARSGERRSLSFRLEVRRSAVPGNPTRQR